MTSPLACLVTPQSEQPLIARSGRSFVIVLVGIDGAGKTTAAHALSRLLESSTPTLVLANVSGRRTMTGWLERTGREVPVSVLDLGESLVRCINVVVNHLRARRFEGVVIMDRHLFCQQALRTARGLRPGRFLNAMMRRLPAPDAVVFLDVAPEEAYRRIAARGLDAESLEELRAYREGYLGLAEFDSFHRMSADVPQLAVLDDLAELIRGLRSRTTAVHCTGGRGRTLPAVARHRDGAATAPRVEVNS